jgi:hypothetical protein
MRAWIVASSLLVPHVAYASTPSLNAGVVDLVAPTADHLGAYPYVALSMIVPKDHVTLIPTIGIEWSPELSAWGFNGALVVDVPVAKTVGLDVIASLVHDQVGGEWNKAAFYAGIGGGCSIFRDTWTFSPSVSLLRGLNVGGWSLAPALNVSYAF